MLNFPQIFASISFMFIKDLLFPKFCLGCGFLGAYICPNCKKKLNPSQNCGKASLYGLTHPVCRRSLGIDGFLSIFYYNNLLKTIIKSIKYRLAVDVWRELCLVVEPDLLNKIGNYKKFINGDFYLVPIPLHPKRFRSRGFNQAKIITQFFNKFLKKPTVECLFRIKDTPSQAQLISNKDRYTNLRGAFEAAAHEAKDKNFVLVDDVATTGSTLKEAARALKKKGARRVYALTLARG